MKIVKVGIADWKVASNGHIIRTSGLGSCVGVTLYDSKRKTGGMAHIMLPESPSGKKHYKRAKYADTGIYDMVVELETKMSCSRNNLIAKIAGGAQMFEFSGGSEMLKIGHRNAMAVEEILKDYGIRIAAKDVGGNYGRTIDLFCETGKLVIKSVKRETKEV